MRHAIRSVGVLLVAMLGVVGLAIGTTISAAVALAASALIVPGTGTPNANLPSVAGYKQNARDYYLGNTACDNATDCPDANLTGINYPASFFPLAIFPGWCVPGRCEKWDDSVGQGVANLGTDVTPFLTGDQQAVLFGYSQGAAVVSNELRALAGLTADQKKNLSAVLIGDIDNPDGGLFTRLGLLGHIPFFDITTGLATPVDSGIPLTVINFEYDGVGDFPRYGGNLLADANAILGFYYIHGTYLQPNAGSGDMGLPDGYTPAEIVDQQNCATHPTNCRYDYHPAGSPQAGQIRNTYILIPSQTLPLVIPLLELGAKTGTTALVKPIVDLISPTLRVLIDLGYDRTVDPGVTARLSLLPFNPRTFRPLKVAGELAVAVAQGVKVALGDLGVPKPATTSTPAITSRKSKLNVSTVAATEPAVSDDSGTAPITDKPVKPKILKTKTPKTTLSDRPVRTKPLKLKPVESEPVDPTSAEPTDLGKKGLGNKGFGAKRAEAKASAEKDAA